MRSDRGNGFVDVPFVTRPERIELPGDRAPLIERAWLAVVDPNLSIPHDIKRRGVATGTDLELNPQFSGPSAPPAAR
jgi:hypothetical protein